MRLYITNKICQDYFVLWGMVGDRLGFEYCTGNGAVALNLGSNDRGAGEGGVSLTVGIPILSYSLTLQALFPNFLICNNLGWEKNTIWGMSEHKRL